MNGKNNSATIKYNVQPTLAEGTHVNSGMEHVMLLINLQASVGEKKCRARIRKIMTQVTITFKNAKTQGQLWKESVIDSSLEHKHITFDHVSLI